MAGSLIDSSGPFHIWDRPAAFPQADLVNGVNDKPVFDLGVDLDNREGVAYLQVDHVISMARILGMVTIEEHTKVLEKLIEREESEPESELERLSNVVSSLDSFIRDRFDFVDSSSDVPVDNPEEPASASNEDDGNSGDVDKSSIVEGSNELSGSTSNGSFGFDNLDSADRK